MVALVVTIVVLLILASISIQGITRTGIFRAAEDTKLEHKRASIATTLQTKLKINETEQIRGTDEEIIKATYEDVKNDLEEIKKAGGKDIEVGEVTSEEKNGKTEWFFEVKVDGDVYKVGLDGSDYLGKEDELSPVIQIKNATATTNTITATVTTRRNEGGKIEYYIKEKGASKFDLAGTTDQNTFKYTKLKQETTYVIEAVAINTNGKKKISNEYEIKTSLVPKIDSKEIKFASVPNTWTNKSVEVTATLTVDGQNFTLATSKNPTSGWIASNRQIFTENGTMYAALTDGNNYGAAASYEVTNIDTVKPVIKNITATTNTIKITATDEASGIYSYAISDSETMPKTFTTIDNNTKIFNKIFENLKQTTKYYVWVKDVAGNISEFASTKTETVPKLTDANATITKSPNDWTKQEVTATASTTEKNYTLQTKKDNGEWQTTNTQKFTENGTIYARLWDGTNAGEEIYKTITNIDKIAPNAFIPKTTVTTNSITVDGTTTDAIATDTNGCSGVKEYRFSKDGGKTYTGAQTSSIYTFNELTQKTEYPIVVEVKDNAENITTGKINATTNTIPKASGATYTPTTWTKGNVTVTLTTMKEYSTVYTTDGTAPTKDSTKYSGTFTVSSNCKIKYLYTDGINIGEAGELDITNIDKTAPTATSVEIKNVTPAGYDVYVYGVQDNGSGVNRVQFPTWTEANGQDDIQPNWQTGESSKGMKQADGTTWVYHVNITDHKTEAGIYNTHIYAYDNLENNKFIGGQKITVPKVKITYDENYVKDGTTNKQTVEKVYNTELGTLGTPTRTGYTFAGWFTEATGGTQISNTTKTPVTDTTYYAHWTANTYTIVYNGNGATGGSTASSNHAYDVAKALTTNGFTRTGYTFAGWNTQANGSGTNYEDSQSVINLSATQGATVTLYAKWTINQYSFDLNYNVDGNWYWSGYNNTGSQRIYTGLKTNGIDRGYVTDYGGKFNYGTSWEIYGLKIDGQVVNYKTSGTLGTSNPLKI